MHVSLIISAGFAATALADVFKRQDAGDNPLIDICYPGISQSSQSADYSTIDLTAPCNALDNITYTCAFGASFNLGGPSGNGSFANTTQRDCVCSSQFFSVIEGCFDCFKAHGAPDTDGAGDDYWLPTSIVLDFSTSYCAATNTPTAGILDLIVDVYASVDPEITATFELSTASTTATYSDPLSGSTAESLYYTPAVTGSSLYYVPEAEVTPASSGVTFSQSIITDSAGIIVPSVATTTTQVTGAAASSTTSGASTSHTGAAATWVAQPALGVIALAGAVMLF